MIGKSIKFKIAATLVCAIVALSSTYSIHLLEEREDVSLKTFFAEISRAKSIVKDTAARALWDFDAERTKSALDGLNQADNYLFGRVISEDHVFIDHNREDYKELDFDNILSESISISDDHRLNNLGEYLVTSTPLLYDGIYIGEMHLAFSTKSLFERRAADVWGSVTTGAVFVAATALLVWFILARLLAPLTHLSDAVRRFSVGDQVDCGTYTARDDEIGELARAVDLLQQTHREAHTDTLTGLPNRRALDDAVSRASSDGAFAVLLVDLDSFKPINDRFGHAAGDIVLQTVAARLVTAMDGRAEVFRIGGDEFAVIARGLSDRAEAARIGEALADDACAPFNLHGEEAFVGVSVGVALSTEVAGGPTDVLSAADAAMYSVKADIANRVSVFDPNGVRRRYCARERRELENAIDALQFEPWFQPQICLATDRLIGFEALARWRHPTQGLLSPGAFMPSLDNLNLQSQFDLAILRQSLRTLGEWRAVFDQPVRLSINVAEATLALKEAADDLFWTLNEHEHLLDQVTIEITEDVFTARSADAIRRTLEGLFDLGVRLSMDDFGTGYGSFRHLQEYKFDELKIDRRFVAAIGRDKSSEVLIKGFLSIAEGLNSEVVAEGVETNEQLEFLKGLNCSVGQGYLFGKAEDAAQARLRLAGQCGAGPQLPLSAAS